jgi:hypothetical protein
MTIRARESEVEICVTVRGLVAFYGNSSRHCGATTMCVRKSRKSLGLASRERHNREAFMHRPNEHMCVCVGNDDSAAFSCVRCARSGMMMMMKM